MISRVIAAWRTLFMYSVNCSIMSAELRVAASIAVIRAACSAAADSSSARNTCTSTWLGIRCVNSSSGAGSYR